MSDPQQPGPDGPADAPGPAAPLDYRSPTTDPVPEGGSAMRNGCAGFGLWVAGVVVALLDARPAAELVFRFLHVTGFSTLVGIGRGQTLVGVVVVQLVAVLGLAVWMRVRWKRRGLIAGLLLGMLLTCLVPIGIVAVVCGPGAFR